MPNKYKPYPILLFLSLVGMMSSNACLGCKNPFINNFQDGYKLQRELLKQRDGQFPSDGPLDAQTKLLNAVAKGQVSNSTLIQLLEQKKIDPTAKDEQGRNIIQNSIYNGATPEQLKIILEQLKQQFPHQEAADQELAQLLNTPDNSSRKDTAFIVAVEKMGEKRDKNYIEMVDILLGNGAKPSLEERKRGLLYCIKLSALETSETNSGMELFQHLAQKFQELAIPIDQATALAIASAAASAGNEDLMRCILEDPVGFPIDAASEDGKGNTLLHYAAAGNGKGQGSQEIIKLLAQLDESNPDYINCVNKQGETALYVALKQELLKNVLALLKVGVKVRSADMAILEELSQKYPNNRNWRIIQNKLAQIFNAAASPSASQQ